MFCAQRRLAKGHILLAQKTALELFEREARGVGSSYPLLVRVRP